jgi:Fe-S cluster assembly protein SufD
MASLATARERYLEEFEALDRENAPHTPPWLAALRRSAIERFAETGFPTTRDEDWRYTNVAPLAAEAFRPVGPGSADLPAEMIERLALGEAGWPRLVFVDGRFSPSGSVRGTLPVEVDLTSLAAALAADGEAVERHLGRHARWDTNAFAALNTALARDGAFLHVPADVALPAPIEFLFVATAPGSQAQPRILVVAGPHSRVAIVERHVGLTGEAYFTNAVAEIAVGPGAAVDHCAIQEQGAGAFHVSTVHASLERDSAFSTCGVTFGGRIARTTLALGFGGEGGQGALSGLYVVGGRQHVDHHVTVDHAVPRCGSRQLYKGVLDGAARAVFRGRILVRPGAQKTDANQTNKHLLLSDGVEVDSKPQLEIYADDVKCTHGAAEGQPAPEGLFYLRSRGLGEAAARRLLTAGFACEVVARIGVERVRDHVERSLAARLGSAGAGEERA